MSVPTRQRTTLEALIPLVKAQIVPSFSGTPSLGIPAVIDSSRIFTALADDRELMLRAPADKFIAIKPDTFPVDEPCVDGGGNDVLWVRGEWTITLFLRYAVDQSFADDQYLTDVNYGVLPAWSKMITALQLFDPVDANGVGYLAEPMRLATPGWRNMPTTHGKVASYGRLKAQFEVSYLHAV